MIGKFLNSYAHLLRNFHLYHIDTSTITYVSLYIAGVRYRKAYGISRQHTNLRTIDQVLLYKSVAVLHVSIQWVKKDRKSVV